MFTANPFYYTVFFPTVNEKYRGRTQTDPHTAAVRGCGSGSVLVPAQLVVLIQQPVGHNIQLVVFFDPIDQPARTQVGIVVFRFGAKGQLEQHRRPAPHSRPP